MWPTLRARISGLLYSRALWTRLKCDCRAMATVAEFPVPDINLYSIETNGHGRRAPDGFHDDSFIPGYHLISSE